MVDLPHNEKKTLHLVEIREEITSLSSALPYILMVYSHISPSLFVDSNDFYFITDIFIHHIKVIEEGILFNSIAAMDEAFLTGTSTQIAAIKRIDGHYFYTNNNIGPVTRRLQEAYRVLKL